MPIRASALPLNTNELTTEHLLIMNANYDLLRTSAQSFRGAGIFVQAGTGTPSTVFPVAGGAYKEGDMVRLTAGVDTSFWYWNVSTWVQFEELTIPTYHTATSLSDQSYDTTITATSTHADFAIGDFYRNLTQQRLFGPSPDGNFDMSIVAGPWVYERGIVQHTHAPASTGRDVRTWSPWDITLVGEQSYLPLHGDTYLQTLVDAAHGGYLWTWDQALYDANGGNTLAKRTAGWGTRVAYRAPRLFTGVVPPVANHDRYITGDEYKDTATGIVYGPYDDSDYTVVSPAADRTSTWGATTSNPFTDVTKVHTQVGYAVSYTGTVNNTTYLAGDFLMVTDGTPGLFGPYDTATTGTWPLMTFLRGNIEFTVTQGADGTWPGVAATTDAVYTVLPINGDSVRYIHVHPTGHAQQGQPNGKQRLGTLTVNYGALTVAVGNILNPLGAQSYANAATGVLPRNDNIYSNGDILFDSDRANYGPYLEGQGTDAAAWPQISTGVSAEALFTQDGTGLTFLMKIDAAGDIYLEEQA